jgi:iron(III) transport system ATP-binding protein
VRATITSIVYQGGRFRLDAAPERAPGVPLHFGVAEPCSLRPGDSVTLAIDDGWVLPGWVTRASGR